ncbi:Gag protease polyprotein, putative [Theobroma cacao]|uniref:Gag protease polyprotein, putative n=1 Tax=Theobroma cacao TaxID=3641 RepID=A0A061ECZ4_THECC|nr:Gag protease polyprotein, putative [Theobroma cacao]
MSIGTSRQLSQARREYRVVTIHVITMPYRREHLPLTRSAGRGRGHSQHSQPDPVEGESAASTIRAAPTAEQTETPPHPPPPPPPTVLPVTHSVPPPPPPVRPPVSNVFISKKLEEARQLGCVSFTSDLDATAAKDWIIQVLETLSDMRLDDDIKLMVTTRLLEKRAHTWWNSVKSRSTTLLTWSNFLREFDRLHNEIRDRMTMTGREPHKEVVQMALRAEKLANENRRMQPKFVKRRNSSISSSQPYKKGKDSSTSGSVTITLVASNRPSSQQPQPKSSRFNRSVTSTFGESFGGFDRC